MLLKKRMTIIKLDKPNDKDINKILQWFGNSLGLFNARDKDKSCFRIFIELLKASKINEPLSSDEIARKLELSRGTVVFHVNKLVDSGLVVAARRRYMLRVSCLSELVEEVHRDVSEACRDLRDVAEEIDRCL